MAFGRPRRPNDPSIMARDIPCTACWASDGRVTVNDRRSHIVVLEVIRRLPAQPPQAWPYRPDRAEADDADSDSDSDSDEPALSGPGHHRPFG